MAPQSVKPLINRKRRGRLMASLCLAASVTIAASACGDSTAAGSGGTGAASLTTVTIGVSSNVFDVPLHLADMQGYFKSQGLKVKYITLSASAAAPALQSGSVNFLMISPDGIFNAINKKLPIVPIAQDASGSPLGLVVSSQFAKAHSLTSSSSAAEIAQALAGSRPGASSTNTKAEAGIFLKANGVDPTQLKWVTLPNPAADQAALKSNQIDWFDTSEPLPLQVQAQGDGVVVGGPDNIPQWSQAQSGYGAFVSATKSWASSHSDLAKKFLTAVQQATAYMNAHPGDSVSLAAAKQVLPSVSDDILKTSLGQVEWPTSARMTDDGWSRTTKFVNSLGTIAGGVHLSPSDWTDQYLP